MIIIPMAGLSSRFFKAGYTEPKYKLKAHDKTLFEWSVKTFEQYYQSEKFIFICRDVYDTPAFVEAELQHMGIKDYEVVVLTAETRGQAETVFLALDKVPDNEPIVIFNIDTHEKHFEFATEANDAYLEVFKGEGEHWSFAQPKGNTTLVERTTEKVRISDLCSNGVYGFKNKETFTNAYIELIRSNPGELYIAPMFNFIIAKGMRVRYKLVEHSDHIFMGTPAEYTDFLGTTNV
ncbi:TPA: glycosyltransferase family 2 protein [Citrobacter braakii]|uniref:Capsular biosynthesis protein n=1 Tax=Salmonella enterica TaxID=28901 RepID=A0A5V5HM27_SALER|nr:MULTISPECIES: glycosyltransferase family 2 protein [Enterobacteriaceae]EBU4654731.1 capsular biosynthesis protein [Salmonella enterica]HCB1496687.1 glycosyltransferase family 2 protein [Citrobacter braakii]EEO5360638.1 capsular biosynthesis protein [Salmonella enterica]EHX1155607.1 glycosyltransferase family 2 protein [Escherichia coli]EHX1638336.1 glycosyltransferase family 2 protein [Escherichia coli]